MKRTIFYLFAFLGTISLSNIAAADGEMPQPNSDNSAKNIQLDEFMENNNIVSQERPAKIAVKEEPKSSGGKWSISNIFGGKDASEQSVAIVKRSNAAVFDIAGVMLQMNSKQAKETLLKRGYRLVNASMSIPNFIRWRYEELCRNKNVSGYERLQSCVVTLARKNNYQFVEHMTFSNFGTKENINITFTSNFTGNKAYIIEYKSEATNVNGSGSKAMYLRNLKIYDFWKKINQKYGEPDNKEQVTWGLGANKPSLHADTGYLILKDPILIELDRSRMLRENQKFLDSSIYTF